MTEIIQELKKKLNFLDCSQTNIQITSELFINSAIEDETMMEDLVKLWKYYCINKSDKLAFIFLANDIIQNSFFKGLKFPEVFFNHLIEVFPYLFNSLNEKVRKEIFRVLDIWEERKIYDASRLENLRQLLTVTTILGPNTLANPLLPQMMMNSKVKISEKIKEFAMNFNEQIKNEDKLNSLISEGEMMEKTENEEVRKANVNKLQDAINSTRGKLLDNSAEIIKKQNQIYFKHVYYLKEVENMLDRIKTSKTSVTNTNKLDDN